jgi:hypothetical protein
MSNTTYTSDVPDPTKPLSRFNAPYWAMMYGIAAALEPAEWKVLCAIYAHLPNVEPGCGRLELLAGVSPATVKRARKRLKRVGLIGYPDDHRGGSHDATTHYDVADIREAAVAAVVVERITGATKNPVATEVIVNGVQGEPRTGLMTNPHGDQDEPRTGVIMNLKVRKRSTQVSSQGKSETAAPLGPGGPVLPPAGSGSFEKEPAEGVPPSTPTAGKQWESLTDEQIRTVRSDINALASFYLFGRNGIGVAPDRWPTMTAISNTNWAPATRNYSKPEPTIKLPALAAYCWCRIMCARAAVGQPLDLPAFGKLSGVVSNLRKRMTHDDILALVDCIGAKWPTICKALPQWWTTQPALDETILNNAEVRKLCDQIGRGQTLTQPVVTSPAARPLDRATLDLNEQLKTRKWAKIA